jgi:D-alanyl-D-alanine carboxypeptidase (penicillin-binding protein 5/6)
MVRLEPAVARGISATIARAWTRVVVALVACAGAMCLPPNVLAPNALAPQALAATVPAPGARAVALLEESTGQEVYGTNASARLPVASTTKLMTALVALGHTRLNQVFAAPTYYLPPQDSQIGLEPGERMSVHDLLIAMMLPSADDAAQDLAYNVGHGSVSRFLAMMNARARQLGLTHTHYTTPSGLDTPGNYSSATDLVNLARYLLQSQPFFKHTVAQAHAVLRTGAHVRSVSNLNDLVTRFHWVNGVKTGHTLGAGYVLVASGTRGGMTLIGAVLGTSSEAARDKAALALLNYGFANFRLRTPVRAGQVLASTGAISRPGVRVPLVAASSFTHVFPRSTRVRLRVHAPAQLAGPLPQNAAVGSVSVVAGNRVVARVPLVLAAPLPKIRPPATHPSALALSVTLSGLVLAAGAAIGLTMFWRRSSRG